MNAGFKAFNVKDFAAPYMHSFGNLAHGTAYVQYPFASNQFFKGTDMRTDWNEVVNKNMAIHQKALTTATGGAGTTDKVLVPIFVDPRMVDVSRKYTPLVEMISRVTNMGITADWNQITAKGGGFFAGEDGPMPEKDNTPARKSVGIKYLYAVGRTTGPSLAATPPYILDGFQATGSGLAGTGFSSVNAPNSVQQNIILQTRAIREAEEEAIVNGDKGSDANEFDGFVKLQGTTNKKDLNSASLSLASLDDAMQNAVDDSGRPNLGVGDTASISDLRKLIIETYNYRPVDMTMKLPFGVSSHLVWESIIGPVPLLFSQNLSTTSGSKSIYLLDLNYVEMRVLQDLTFEKLAKTNDSDKFMLKIYEALILRNEAFNAFVGEIGPSPA